MKIDKLTPKDWIQTTPRLPQRFARWLFTHPGRFFYRYRGYGATTPRVPNKGGFLLAPGPHGAFADPFIFALGQERTQIRFMTKYQALEWPIIGRIIRWGGGFPVHRGNGRSHDALEIARAVLRSGDGVVIFMEGRLELDHPNLGIPRSGLARLALETGVPVIPVAAWGAKRARAYGKRWWWHWPKVTVVWGEQIQFMTEIDPDESRIAEVRDEIWANVTRCFEHAKEIAHRNGRRPKRGSTLKQALKNDG